MVNLLRKDLAQAFAITDKAAANEAGGVALWDMPPVYSAAYNPIVITRTQYLFALDGQSASGEGVLTDGTSTLYPDPTPTTAIVTIAETDGSRRATLSAESFNGITTFDVSAVVRLWFNEQLAATANMPVIDRKLFVRYRIEDTGVPNLSQRFMALNAVAQVGESSNMGAYIGKILTRAPRLMMYDGYQSDFSALITEGVERGDTSVNTMLLLSEAGDPILTENGEDIYVVVGYGMPVTRECVPVQPFYVRWVNQLGGVDYWMFRKQQEFAPTVKSTAMYERFVANPLDARSNRQGYAITTEHTVTVGAEHIPAEFFDMLAWLPFSPFIEWYNEKLGKWVALTVAKYDGAIQTKDALHGMEITFNLPAINTQF